MARAKRHKTRYYGVYYRDIYKGDREKGRRVYDVKVGKVWISKGKHTKIEAAKAERDRAAADGVTPTRSQTLRDFAEQVWLPHLDSRVADGSLRSSSRDQYKRDLDHHLLPALGTMRLDRLDVPHVEKLRGDLLKKKSNDTVRRIINTLGYVMKHARRGRHGIRYNPVEDVAKPSPRRREPELPTIEQVYALADAAPGFVERNMILFAAFTGIRKSELFALRWESVDLTEGAETIRIVEQYYKGELVPRAKTRAGNREIVLGSEAAAILREQSVALQVNERPNAHGLVFPAVKGGYWRDTFFQTYAWNPAREAVGLPKLMFHALRYFHVSHVRAMTSLPSALTEQLLGHSDGRTHRGYTRPVAGTHDFIREQLDGVFIRPAASAA